MLKQRFDFERVANAAGYFRMNLGRVRSKADFDSCERAGLFSQEIFLTLDPETRAVPNRRELKSCASEIAPGVFQPNLTIDWLEIFGGSWSITASVSDDIWLDQFLKSYSNPVVVTYTTIENSSFSELLALIRIRPEAILVSLNESRGVTVIGRGAAYERIVRAAALRKATIDQAKRTAFTIDDYSASALKSAEKFARSLARLITTESSARNSKKKPNKLEVSFTRAEEQASPKRIEPKEIRSKYLAGSLVGSNWFTDGANLAHLTFFSASEIARETQELCEHLEEVESSVGLEGESVVAIGRFLNSADAIGLMLSGSHTGAIVIFFHEVDDQILAPSLEQFVGQLKSADRSLLKRFGVAKFNRDGKLVAPHEL